MEIGFFDAGVGVGGVEGRIRIRDDREEYGTLLALVSLEGRFNPCRRGSLSSECYFRLTS